MNRYVKRQYYMKNTCVTLLRYGWKLFAGELLFRYILSYGVIFAYRNYQSIIFIYSSHDLELCLLQYIWCYFFECRWPHLQLITPLSPQTKRQLNVDSSSEHWVNKTDREVGKEWKLWMMTNELNTTKVMKVYWPEWQTRWQLSG